MSDRELVVRLRELLREERRVTAAVLEHLGEVEARKLLAPQLTDESAAELVVEARRAPRPDVAQRLERAMEQRALAPEPPGQSERKARVTPLAPERFALQLTLSRATHQKLVRAALGAPGNPHASGGAAAVAAPDTG